MKKDYITSKGIEFSIIESSENILYIDENDGILEWSNTSVNKELIKDMVRYLQGGI